METKTSLSTLCQIEKDGKYLMLHRTVKEDDVNHDKWIGVGGHFEENESPEECLLREVKEETGYTLTSWRFRGIVTFISGTGITEYMHLFTADGFTGEEIACDEGELVWVDKDKVCDLNIWAGDKIFFRLLHDEEPFFSLKLVYDGHDRLVSASLNGKDMELFELLNEDGTKSGVVQERSVVHWEGSLHETVHTWIVRRRPQSAGKDADGFGTQPAAPGPASGWEVLLQKRSANKDSNPGCLDISSAGHMQAGDEVMEAALREMKEELGIEAAPEDLEFIASHRAGYQKEFYGRMFRDYEQMNIFLYTKPVDITSLRLQEEEVESVRWVPLEELQHMVYERSERSCIYRTEYDIVSGELASRM